MKKTYQNPQIAIVKIDTTQMIAASLPYGGTTDQTGGNFSRELDFSFEDNTTNTLMGQ